jgi:2',3'-cyclic-nucleotide 2'-phosphodiesterase (5'-nucleotidase family)
MDHFYIVGIIQAMTRARFLNLPIAIALALLPAAAFAQEKLDLTILHTNDIHGHVLPHVYAEEGYPGGKGEFVRGGIARIATLARQLKRSIKNPTMLIDLGDTATRGPLTNAHEGIADIEAMNAAGYELGVVGNNEFKLKDGYERRDNTGAQAALMKVLRRSKFPWVCANAGEQPNGLLPGVGPFLVREIQGVKVGFLGLTAPRSAGYPQVVGWWVGDPVESAKKWIPLARKECDVLIAVTHVGVDDDKKLVAATAGIDAVIGGDSHTFLYKPEMVKNTEGKEIPIVQSGEFGVNLARFDLHFEKGATGWGLARHEYKLIPITPRIKEAPDVKAVADRYAGPLQREVVAMLPPTLIGKTIEERTTLTAQATVDGLQRGTGAEVAVTLPGAGSFEVFRTPTVSRYDLHTVWPFKNRVATVKLTGRELIALKTKHPTMVTSSNVVVLEESRTYTVAVIDFVATGELGIAAEKLTIGDDMRDVFAKGWATR